MFQVLLVLAVCSEVSGGRRRYSRRKYGRKYQSHHHHSPRHHHKHHHTTEYYEPSYERTYEKEYKPTYEEDVVYEDELDYSEGDRVVFDTGSRYGGLDLAAALGLTGVGYVANSGGALHIVGRR